MVLREVIKIKAYAYMLKIFEFFHPVKKQK